MEITRTIQLSARVSIANTARQQQQQNGSIQRITLRNLSIYIAFRLSRPLPSISIQIHIRKHIYSPGSPQVRFGLLNVQRRLREPAYRVGMNGDFATTSVIGWRWRRIVCFLWSSAYVPKCFNGVLPVGHVEKRRLCFYIPNLICCVFIYILVRELCVIVWYLTIPISTFIHFMYTCIWATQGCQLF